MIHYIIQVLAFQLLFLAVYDLFLKKETFYNLNRIYLLLTPILGFLLPFLKVSYIQQNIPQGYIIKLPAVMIGSNPSEHITTGSTILFADLGTIWILGMFFSLLFFGWKFFKILKLKSLGNTAECKDFKMIVLPKTDTAFSFFSTIYLGENLSEENRKNIIAHEKIHIKQKHSLDLIFFEILRIVFWFNPLVYVFQNKLAALHEYIADANVSEQNNKKEYYQNLLSQVFQTDKISFINTFFNHSLIKKRIVMLQKSKSPKIAQFKYLLLLPIICVMLVYASCSNDPKTEETQAVQNSDSEVMTKINELGDAIMKKGEITPEEAKALKFLATEAKPGDKVYTSVQQYLGESVDENNLPVPFAVIEKVPTYPGCTGDNEAKKLCMSQNISSLINKNFNTGLGKELGLKGRQRIAVQFKIDKTGKVVDIRGKSLSNVPELEAEAVRVVKMLPQMKPGEQKGEKVGVLYSLPIVFNIQE